jgi:hypothetical protein
VRKARPTSVFLVALCLSPWLLAGCGAQRGQVPDLSQTESPDASVPFTLPDGDVTFTYPSNWAPVGRPPPGIATVASGGASFTVWAYESVAGVTDPSSTELARQRLLTSLRERDPTFKVSSSKVTKVDGAPAVEIRGSGQIGGRPMVTRSVHIYKGRGEYVFDAFADPDVFERANREVFDVALASLKVAGSPPARGETTAAPPASAAAPAAP